MSILPHRESVAPPGQRGELIIGLIAGACLVLFVILLAQGQLPAHFALPAGWGDIANNPTDIAARRALLERASTLAFNLRGTHDALNVLRLQLERMLGGYIPSLRELWGVPVIFLVAIQFITTVLCKSMNALALCVLAGTAQGQGVAWQDLSDAQKRLLAPHEQRWDELDPQRDRRDPRGSRPAHSFCAWP